MSSQINSKKILELFLSHLVGIKTFHFVTKKYSRHKSSDDYYTKFSDTFDQFMEVMQGKYGRIDKSKLAIDGSIVSDDNILVSLEKFKKVLMYLTKLFPNDGDLLTIRDEMMINLNQFIYLIDFN